MNLGKIPSFTAVTLLMLGWFPFHLLAGLDPDLMRVTNLLSLFVILVGSLGAAASSVAAAPVRIWFPITWFLLTAAAYYGFGPMLYYYGTEETIEFSDAYCSEVLFGVPISTTPCARTLAAMCVMKAGSSSG